MPLQKRLISLDVFRGITIVLMILVNSPGNSTPYLWLEHSAWNGCTFADLVFPFFIFIVGVSIAFSLTSLQEKNLSFASIMFKVIKRSIIIFLIGLFLNAFPSHMSFETIRYFGVLQRIAICYFLGSLIFLTTHARTQVIIMLGLLVTYWLIMTFIPVPGYGIHNLTREGNLGAYLDRLVFSSPHLYEKIFDPEGFLSTLPAIATVLLGNITGIWLQTKSSNEKKLFALVFAGMVAAITGWLWGLSFPINKGLWTSSFVLWTGGLALLLLALCYWLIEIKHWQTWSKPFEIFGLNAIAAYFLHIFFLKLQAMVHIPQANGLPGNLRIYITENLYGWTSAQNASLLYSLSYILFWLLILSILYKNKIYIKV